MSLTLEERLAFALTVLRGSTELPRTSRYRKFTTKDDGVFYFIGVNGALRKGRNATTSRSLSDTEFYKLLLRLTTPEGMAALQQVQSGEATQ